MTSKSSKSQKGALRRKSLGELGELIAIKALVDNSFCENCESSMIINTTIHSLTYTLRRGESVTSLASRRGTSIKQMVN